MQRDHTRLDRPLSLTVVLLLTFLLAQPLAAAAFPRALTTGFPVTTQGGVVAVALDGDGDWGAAVTADTPQASESEVYSFVLSSGKLWESDPDDTSICTPNAIGAPTCQTIPNTTAEGKTAVAISRTSGTGTRWIAAGGPFGEVAFYAAPNRDLAVANRKQLPDTANEQAVVVNSVAMSADGTKAIVGTGLVGGATGQAEGKSVYFFTQGSGQVFQLTWRYNFTNEVKAVALTDSGSVGVAAGKAQADGSWGQVILFGTGTSPPQILLSYNETNDPFTTVAMTSDGKYVVAGTSKGQILLLTNDPSGADACGIGFSAAKANPFRSPQPTGSPITKVAISGNGDHFAAGDAAGKVLVFRNRRDFCTPAEQIATVTPAGPAARDPVTGLTMSGDGAYLVAAAGVIVTGYHLPSMPGRTQPIWANNFGGVITDAAMSVNGRRILLGGRTATPDQGRVYAYEQFYDFTLTLAAQNVSVNPDEKAVFRVNITNTGSFADRYVFAPLLPAEGNWLVEPISEITLLPGEGRDVTVTVTPPSVLRPGIYNTTLNVTGVANPNANTRVARHVVLGTQMLQRSLLELTLGVTNPTVDRGVDRTVPVLVRNIGNGPDTFFLSVSQAPSGATWDLQLNDTSITLEGSVGGVVSEARTSLLVRAPSSAAEGDYNDVTIRGRSQNAPNVERDLRFTIRVNPRYEASLTADGESTTLSVESGIGETHRLTLANTGNTRDTFDMNVSVRGATGRGKWIVSLSKEEVTLGRGQSEPVTLSVTAPAGAELSEQVSIVITVTSRSLREEVDTLRLTAVVAEEEDKFLGIPGLDPALVLSTLVVSGLLARRRRTPPR
ncbi:MAG: hypothetical protein ACT4PT_13150 [Methanobacteriota archaeon]